jgi:hypothetical protein
MVSRKALEHPLLEALICAWPWGRDVWSKRAHDVRLAASWLVFRAKDGMEGEREARRKFKEEEKEIEANGHGREKGGEGRRG